MAEDIVIKAENLSKKFCRSLKHVMLYGARDIASNMAGLSSHSEKLRDGEFWAVDDVSFEIKRGETLGIIGPNGSGKSTMLKMINGIFMPDRGRIEIKGRVGALIEVGAGFHPMLTGRENIYVNGAILGMNKKEIDGKFDEIVDFADIGDFIDAPVKHYSSGMHVRLGFAIAAQCEPDILLIDEVLAVGDLSFQNKSMRKLAELREGSKALVYVSHKLDTVQNLCKKVLVIDKGKLVFYGNSYEALQCYYKLSRENELHSLIKQGRGLETDRYISSGDIRLLDAGILDESGIKIERIQQGNDIKVFIDFISNVAISDPSFSVNIINTKREHCIFHKSQDYSKTFETIKPGKYRLVVKFKKPALTPGVYSITFAVINASTLELVEKYTGQNLSFIVDGYGISRGIVFAESEWNIENKL